MKNIMFLISLVGILFANSGKMQVFQPPYSTCPKSWFKDMEKISNDVSVITIMNVKNLKRNIGIPREVQSCNTTIMGDYVFEGNVPSSAIKDFLKKKPKNTIGLALPSSENDKSKKKVFLIFEDSTYKLFGIY